MSSSPPAEWEAIEEYTPLIGRHRPSPVALFFLLSMRRLDLLDVQGLERSSCTCLAYVAFSCLARLAPGFDSSGAFTSDCLEIVYMAVLAAWPTTILHLLVFSIPLGFEIRRCAAARTLGPANDLMLGWTPDFWCGDVRHECAQLWAALTCVSAWSVYAKGPALDPFHAGVVGAVGR